MLLTVGAFVGAALLFKDKLKKAKDGLIDDANGIVGDLIENAMKNVQGLVDDLENKYENQMDWTIEQIDQLTTTKLEELNKTFGKITNEIDDSIKEFQKNAKDLLDELKKDIDDTIERINRTLILGGYVFDRLFYNVFTIAGWVLLGIGLLILIVMLTKRGIPEGFVGILVIILILVFVGGFGGIALVPKFRYWVMRFTGLGFKGFLEEFSLGPVINSIEPNIIIIGQTKSISVSGTELIFKDNVPSVKIGGIDCPIMASDSNNLTVNVSGVKGISAGDTNLVLIYPNEDGDLSVNKIITISKPVDLIIEKISISPAQPKVGTSVTATINVKNNGIGEVDEFNTVWKPMPDHPGLEETGYDLKPGSSKEIQFHYTYTKEGSYTSVAEVDADKEVDETNEGNNKKSHKVVVKPKQFFTKVKFLTYEGEADVTKIEVQKLDFSIVRKGESTQWNFTTNAKPGQPINKEKTYHDVAKGTEIEIFGDIKFKIKSSGTVLEGAFKNEKDIVLPTSFTPKKEVKEVIAIAKFKLGGINIKVEIKLNTEFSSGAS